MNGNILFQMDTGDLFLLYFIILDQRQVQSLSSFSVCWIKKFVIFIY